MSNEIRKGFGSLMGVLYTGSASNPTPICVLSRTRTYIIQLRRLLPHPLGYEHVSYFTGSS